MADRGYNRTCFDNKALGNNTPHTKNENLKVKFIKFTIRAIIKWKCSEQKILQATCVATLDKIRNVSTCVKTIV